MMYKKFLKRLFDIIISLISLIILLPLFIVISILIKKDNGKIIYKQIRTGKNGKDFTIYKFKTMKDKIITPVSEKLRKFGLDELPQLINIIKGDMSIIGPRPWITDYYKNFNDEQKRRVSVRPGLIGLAQLKGNNISVFEKIDYDLKYIDNLSFKLDLRIVIDSVKLIFKKKHKEINEDEIGLEIKQLEMQEKI